MKQVNVVGAVIRNAHDEILCALRSPHMVLPDLWEFPGGKIEPGETPEASLMREIREELGCAVAVGPLVADVVHDYPQVRVRLMTYEARITEGTPQAGEHARLLWCLPAALHELEWAPADLPTVAALQAGVSR